MAEGRTAFAVQEDGWYVEPEKATEFLLARETFWGRIWDPACGKGNIVRTCIRHNLNAVGTDLRDRFQASDRLSPPPWFLGTQDFTKSQRLRDLSIQAVICNPPYGQALLAEQFIRLALAMPRLEKLAAFVNAKFLFSDGRAEGLYAELPPDRVYPVRPRPSCPPGEFIEAGGKAEGGVENFVWLVYDLVQPTGRSEMIWR